MKDLNKVIQVIRNMIINSDKIINIEREIKTNAYYFIYKGYVWSIWKWSSIDDNIVGYSLAYYPGLKNISDATSPIIGRDFIVYTSDDLKSDEVLNLYAQLYDIIKEKFFGVDKVFDDILNA